MGPEDISAAVEQIAEAIAAANKNLDEVVLIGIIERGNIIAQRLAGVFEKKAHTTVLVGSLDIALYRDDIATKGQSIVVRKSDIPFPIDGKTVILVDDVIYHGRTIRAAMDQLTDFGRAARIQLAVLIDRGHRELPIHPDFVGVKTDTGKSEDVIVQLKEIDGADKVLIR
jgi:pyrimidine operon attenuation protein/uracil phosphoribosyltransferase